MDIRSLKIMANVRKSLYGLIGSAVIGFASSVSAQSDSQINLNPSYPEYYQKETRFTALPFALQEAYRNANECRELDTNTLPKPKIELLLFHLQESEAQGLPVIFVHDIQTNSEERKGMAKKYESRDSEVMEHIDTHIKKTGYLAVNPDLPLNLFYRKVEEKGLESSLEYYQETMAEDFASAWGNERYIVQLDSSLLEYRQDGITYPSGQLVRILNLMDVPLTGEWECVDIPNANDLRRRVFKETSKFGWDGFLEKQDPDLKPWLLIRHMLEDKKFVMVYKVRDGKNDT